MTTVLPRVAGLLMALTGSVAGFAMTLVGLGVAAGGGEQLKQLADAALRLAEAIAPVALAMGDMMLPIIEAITDAVVFLIDLLGTQTVAWIGVGVAVAGVAVALGKLAIGLGVVVVGLVAMIAKQIIALALMGPLGWAILAGAGVAAYAATRALGGAMESGGERGDGGRGGRGRAARRRAASAALKTCRPLTSGLPPPRRRRLRSVGR